MRHWVTVNYMVCILLGVSLILIKMILLTRFKNYLKKRKYLITKNHQSFNKKLLNEISKIGVLEKILCHITIKISVLNDNSYEKNKEKSVIVLLLFLLVMILNFSVIIPNIKIIWYLYIFYLILGVILLICIIYTIELVLKMHFTKLLPVTYKILNSRFTTEEDILKAIDESLMDFHPAIRREMIRIRNVLRKNDSNRIHNTFNLMEKTYKNEYFTVLLNLIQQAYYKGGKESIKSQFETVTEEILIDIENQKDLALTSRMYVVISLFLPFGIRWLEDFNQKALGVSSIEFYASPLGIGFKIFLLLMLLVYIISLLFLERTA